MQIFKIEKDIQVFYITAPSFPETVKETHEKMHLLIPFDPNRKSFGISYPVKTGKIIYKVAAEELKKGELKTHGLEEMIIPEGEYLYIDIPDFTKDIPAIGKAFNKILEDKSIDPNGFCLEWYLNHNLCRCMVKIKN